MTPRYTLIDAGQKHRDHPESFEVPDALALLRIVPGAFVKVGAKFTSDAPDVIPRAERFWLIVRTVGIPLTGEINNDLVYTAEHGLKCGDILPFELRHVLDVMTTEEARRPA